MRGSRLWLSSLCSAGLLSIGCGPPPPDVTDGGGVEQELQLSAVGNVALTAHANDIITLRTQLVQTNSIVNPDGSLSPRPIAEETVRFKFLEQPGQMDLSPAEASSDQNGLTQTTLALGSNVTGQVRLRADATGATSTAEWTITIQP